MTSTKKITDFVLFNPKRTIKKGETKPFIEMAALPVDRRDISEIGSRIYKGGGSRFQDGDTLFARITPCLENGKTAKASELGDGVIAHGSTEFIVMAAKEPVYDEEYVYYLARLPEFRDYAQSRMEGTSGRQRVSWQSLAEFEFDFPDKEDRKEIGRILKSIDDKIQVNNQLNQTLERIAQAIFKSWFVDFEPVRTKIAVLEAGGTAEQAELAAMSAISAKDEATLKQLQADQPEAYAELEQTAALFPSAMEESELGEIPEGWEVTKTEQLAEKIAMGPFGSNIKVSTFVDSGVPIISGHHLKETLVTEGDHKFITEEHAKKLKNSCVTRGDIIFTHAGNIGQVSLIPENTDYEKYVISQRQFYLRTDRKKASPYFLVFFYRSKYGQHILLSNTSQVGVPAIARPSSHLKSIELVKPSFELMSEFESVCRTLMNTVVSNRTQSQKLSNLRDTLLPKLLSGDLPITNTEVA